MTLRQSPKRRAVLRAAALSALSGTLGSKLELMGSALAADYSGIRDYKALVCVFLYGGSDSFEMFLPTDARNFRHYAASRQQLSIARNAVLRGRGGAIGFHPSLPGVRSLYDQGDLAIIRNVGNLITPVTRASYKSRAVPIPSDLYTHDMQQEQWQKGIASVPASVTLSGWGGRMADLLEQANQGAELPPTFSINNANYWQPGAVTSPVSVHRGYGLPLLPQLDGTKSRSNIARDQTMQAILNLQRSHPLKQQAARTFTRARDSSRALADVIENAPSFITPYNSGNNLASQLRMVANLIAGQQSLSMQRQVFFVGMGGWDTHDNHTDRIPVLLSELDEALVSFQQTINEMNLSDQVTTFTASEFGRTLTVNGDGTDHGWGGNYLVMGGSVRGRRVFGQGIDYRTGGPDDADNDGRVIPTTSINQYGAMLGRWLGLKNADLDDIFPDLRNFGSNWRDDVRFI